MNKKQVILPAAAAIVFLCGLLLMIGLSSRDPVPPAASTSSEPIQEVIAPDVTEPSAPLETDPVTLPPETEPPVEQTEPPETMPPAELELTASTAFVYHTGEDRYLYIGGDSEEKLAPASLTKLLTAYTALSCMEPEQIVTVGNEVTWIDPWSSVAQLQPGHQLTVAMLIQGLMMPSGNDAAYTLAVAGGRVLAEDPELDRKMAYGIFVDEMNAQARSLGMTGTHFANPDGIDEEGHYTTVQDLVTITKAVMDISMIMEYGNTAEDQVVFASGETITWKNSNLLLHEDSEYYTQSAVGLKTGSTQNAGACLISLFEQEDGSYLIVGVLGSIGNEQRYDDTLILYNRYA